MIFGAYKKRSLDLDEIPDDGPRWCHFVSAIVGTEVSVLTVAASGAIAGAAVSGATGNDPVKGALIGGALGAGGELLLGSGAIAGAGVDAFGSAAPAAWGAGADLSGAGAAGMSGIVGADGATTLGGLSSGLAGAGSDAAASTGAMTGLAADGSTTLGPSIVSGAGASAPALNIAAAGPTASGAAGAAGGVGGISKTSLVLGALSAANSVLNKPKAANYATPGPSSTAGTQGPLFNAPLTGAGGTQRTTTNPFANNPQGIYTYGQNPNGEQIFFPGNNLNFQYGAPVPAAKGGALNSLRTQSTAQGDRYIRGPGTHTSDSIPARLSDGEFVLDYGDVTAIGRGSNERGAAIIEKGRRNKGALARAFSQAAAGKHARAA